MRNSHLAGQLAEDQTPAGATNDQMGMLSVLLDSYQGESGRVSKEDAAPA
ncbi:hypothetical protein GCM10010372_82280 [Streptomyces tauricus]|nr:hypothetical protein GCM10010372_82280 [Streptomyces tauricus]